MSPVSVKLRNSRSSNAARFFNPASVTSVLARYRDLRFLSRVSSFNLVGNVRVVQVQVNEVFENGDVLHPSSANFTRCRSRMASFGNAARCSFRVGHFGRVEGERINVFERGEFLQIGVGHRLASQIHLRVDAVALSDFAAQFLDKLGSLIFGFVGGTAGEASTSSDMAPQNINRSMRDPSGDCNESRSYHTLGRHTSSSSCISHSHSAAPSTCLRSHPIAIIPFFGNFTFLRRIFAAICRRAARPWWAKFGSLASTPASRVWRNC